MIGSMSISPPTQLQRRITYVRPECQHTFVFDFADDAPGRISLNCSWGQLAENPAIVFDWSDVTRLAALLMADARQKSVMNQSNK